jgi:hypothetical protein
MFKKLLVVLGVFGVVAFTGCSVQTSSNDVKSEITMDWQGVKVITESKDEDGQVEKNEMNLEIPAVKAVIEHGIDQAIINKSDDGLEIYHKDNHDEQNISMNDDEIIYQNRGEGANVQITKNNDGIKVNNYSEGVEFVWDKDGIRVISTDKE